MSESKDPKEFWIVWKSGYKNQATVYNSGQTRSEQGTHVIEMKAYDALKAENEELKESIDNIIDRHNDSTNSLQTRLAECEKYLFNELTTDGKISERMKIRDEAREYFKKWGGE